MWQWYALTAMACFAAMQLIFKYLTARGVTTPALLAYVFGIAAILYIVHVRTMRVAMPLQATEILWLVAAAALSYFGNLCSVRAMAAAPNPGYASAISGVHALVVTVVAIFVFGLAVSWTKLSGVVLCVLGIALLLS
jgi:drug/metabolite transporter (DMT)-like permease